MELPVNPPVLPMLAKRVGALPDGDGWIFEPKWDGFRTLVFRDGDEVLHPEPRRETARPLLPGAAVAPLIAQLPPRCVLDGEIVIARDGGLDFEALQLRIHPADVAREAALAGDPGSVVFFDLLCDGRRGPPRRRRSRERRARARDAPRAARTRRST